MVVRLLKILVGLVAGVVILAAVLGAVSFFVIGNLDPNMFRKELAQYLNQQTGYRTELGEIHLRWGMLAEIEADGLAFHHPQSNVVLLQSSRVKIQADLTSLWHKQFRMSHVVIQSPEVFIHRGVDGFWNWQIREPEPPLGAAAPAAQPVSPEGFRAEAVVVSVPKATTGFLKELVRKETESWKFGLGRIEIQDGSVQLIDETIRPAYELKVNHLDAEIQDKSSSGNLHFKAEASVLGSAKNNLQVEGQYDLHSRNSGFTLRYKADQAILEGKLEFVQNTPRFDGKLEIRDLDLEEVIPPVYKKGEYLNGRLNAKMQAAFEGANPEMIQRSLQGQAAVEIRGGALKNRNLIREVFDRLTPAIVVMGALGGELPPQVAAMLSGRDTPFRTLKLSGLVASGAAQIQQFEISHENYLLAGSGVYGVPDRRIDASLQLIFSKAISDYLLRKIHELAYLADRNGQVAIPFRYSGVFPNVSAQPDLSYVSNRLLQAGAEQLINKGLKKLSKFLEKR